LNKWGFSTVFQGASKPIQRGGKSAIREAIFRAEVPPFQPRMQADMNEFSCLNGRPPENC
jgi:hypothetical protein